MVGTSVFSENTVTCFMLVCCRRALLGLNMRKVFRSVEVMEIKDRKLACEREQTVDPREQDFDLIQIWDLKYEEVCPVYSRYRVGDGGIR